MAYKAKLVRVGNIRFGQNDFEVEIYDDTGVNDSFNKTFSINAGSGMTKAEYIQQVKDYVKNLNSAAAITDSLKTQINQDV